MALFSLSNFVIDFLVEGNFFQQSVNRINFLDHQLPDKTTFLGLLTGFKLYFHAMPLIHLHHSNSCRLGLWQIAEGVPFFEQQIPYRSEALNQARKLQQLASRMVLNELEAGFPFDGVVLNHAGKPMLVSKNTYFSISHTSRSMYAEPYPVWSRQSDDLRVQPASASARSASDLDTKIPNVL